MKQRLLLFLLTLLTTLTAGADDTFNVTANGIEWKCTVIGSTTTVKIKPAGTVSGAVTIPSTVIRGGIDYTVTEIGESAFGGCTGLTSVTLPTDLETIAHDAFDDCQSLKSISLPDHLKTIGGCAFFDCVLLSSVTIPASVTSIGLTPFQGCTALASISVASGNSKFDSRDGCNAIIETSSRTLIVGCMNTKIPNGVTSIDNFAFSVCTNLASIAIPASVTSIGTMAFNGCDALASVTLPASLTSIGDGAFSSCDDLKEVTVYAPSCTLGTNVFDDTHTDLKIYVFRDKESNYEGATNWMDYASIIEPITSVGVSDVNANQNPEVASDFWCTYYHPQANVKINTAGVEIYKAKLSDAKDQVTLTKVDGSIIKAGQAVMLKGPNGGPFDMELTSTAPTGDFSDNDLMGGATVPTGYTPYTLAAKSGKMGFYKFTGTLTASKAHLEILTPTSSPAREFVGFNNEATGLIPSPIPEQSSPTRSLSPRGEGSIYTLDGRKIDGKPVKKGVYVRDGKKYIK